MTHKDRYRIGVYSEIDGSTVEGEYGSDDRKLVQREADRLGELPGNFVYDYFVLDAQARITSTLVEQTGTRGGRDKQDNL